LYSLPFGALLVATGTLTLSKYILVLCLSFGISPLLLKLMGVAGALPQVNYKIQALEKIMDREPLKTGDNDFTGADYSVELDDVHFGYRGKEVIRGVSFVVPQNTHTAIIGESGSGKTTIARLVSHEFDPSGGVIKIGGVKVPTLREDVMSGLVSYVSQDVFLFNRSIKENILLGNTEATDEEYRTAVHKAGCDFIYELENGEDTLAGTGGNKLSGGQKQRITFARAILKDAPILILDEATSSVDPENERLMVKAMDEMKRGKTLISIAHKISSVRDADNIIVLGNGRILKQGKYADIFREEGGAANA